jgi:hypothetical protein
MRATPLGWSQLVSTWSVFKTLYKIELNVSSVIAASATVLPILHMTTRPFVTNIFIDIPAWARRSKKTLQDFSKQLPADTTLEIETMGLLPWPRTKAVRISDLRILPQGYGRLANLEQVVPADDTSKVPKSMRWSLEQFYARPVISRWKNSRAPEVWPLVLETISMNGNAFAPGKGKPVQTMRPTPARLPRAAALRTPAVPASKQNVRNK